MRTRTIARLLPLALVAVLSVFSPWIGVASLLPLEIEVIPIRSPALVRTATDGNLVLGIDEFDELYRRETLGSWTRLSIEASPVDIVWSGSSFVMLVEDGLLLSEDGIGWREVWIPGDGFDRLDAHGDRVALIGNALATTEDLVHWNYDNTDRSQVVAVGPEAFVVANGRRLEFHLPYGVRTVDVPDWVRDIEWSSEGFLILESKRLSTTVDGRDLLPIGEFEDARRVLGSEGRIAVLDRRSRDEILVRTSAQEQWRGLEMPGRGRAEDLEWLGDRLGVFALRYELTVGAELDSESLIVSGHPYRPDWTVAGGGELLAFDDEQLWLLANESWRPVEIAPGVPLDEDLQVVRAGGRWIAANGISLHASDDAIAWQVLPLVLPTAASRLAGAGGKLFSLGMATRYADGDRWIELPVQLTEIAYDGQRWVGVRGGAAFASEDLEIWTPIPSDLGGPARIIGAGEGRTYVEIDDCDGYCSLGGDLYFGVIEGSTFIAAPLPEGYGYQTGITCNLGGTCYFTDPDTDQIVWRGALVLGRMIQVELDEHRRELLAWDGSGPWERQVIPLEERRRELSAFVDRVRELDGDDSRLWIGSSRLMTAPHRVEVALEADFGFARGGLELHFVDRSRGRPVAWHWDFGDGSVADLAHPSHHYATPGSYRVRLTVSDRLGSTSVIEKQVEASELVAPVAEFFVESNLVEIGELVRTRNQSRFGEGYLWRSGEQLSTDFEPEIRFATGGRHEIQLSVSNAVGFDQTSASVYVLDEQEPRTLDWESGEAIDVASGQPCRELVPVVASTPGFAGSEWISNLNLVSAGPGETVLYLLRSESDNAEAQGYVFDDPPPLRVEDPLVRLFGSDGSGALLVCNGDTSGWVVNHSSSGRYGQSIPALATSSQGELWLQGLRAGPGFRVNVGLVDLSGVGLGLELILYGERGEILRREEVQLRPLEHRQLNRWFGGELRVASLAVRTLSGDESRFQAYASLVDEQSGDPSFIRPQRPAPEALIPVVVRSPGVGGSFWRSDLVLSSPSDQPQGVELAFFPFDGGEVIRRSHELGPRQTLLLEDVVDAVGGDGKYWVEISGSELAVSSRTWTDNGEGSFGQTIVSGRPGTLIRGINDPAKGYRLNIGLVNRSAEDRLIEIEIDGAHTQTVFVGALRGRQLAAEELPVFDGTISVAGVDGDEVLVYLSMVDESTNDPLTLD